MFTWIPMLTRSWFGSKLKPNDVTHWLGHGEHHGTDSNYRYPPVNERTRLKLPILWLKFPFHQPLYLTIIGLRPGRPAPNAPLEPHTPGAALRALRGAALRALRGARPGRWWPHFPADPLKSKGGAPVFIPFFVQFPQWITNPTLYNCIL